VIPVITLGAFFTIFRIVTGSPYSTSVPLTRVAINSVYYFAVEILALPDNYGYQTALPLWQQEPLFPVAALTLTTTSLIILCLGTLACRRWPGWKNCSVAIKFAVAWSVIALFPVLLTAAGRTSFLSSMGVIWALAIVTSANWDASIMRHGGKRWALAALAMYLSALTLISSYRAYWWRESGELSLSVVQQLDMLSQAHQDIREDVWIVGLPDHLRHAYTFRNAFPSASRLIAPAWRITAILDTELDGQSKDQAATRVSDANPNAVVLVYEKGRLERVASP
jgi:hypothetical protein